ncbi:MAG: hypothetical protein SGJ00_11705 [bacterium]|nr:hypothetical protein [bacterium]
MQKNINFHRGWYFGSLAVLLIGFVAFKFEALFLPYFWDEAWVYMPAIRTMSEVGPSMLPGSIDANLYTGHPLLFYFLASTWIKLFGSSLWVAHSFPLLISVTLLLSVFYVAYRWSKESAFCLVPCFMLLTVVDFFLLKERGKEMLLKMAGIILLFIIGFSFFFLQKLKLGWYFFPRHSNWITIEDFQYKFDLAFDILFKQQGRVWYYVLAFVCAVISLLIVGHRYKKIQLVKILGILIFTFGFSLFAAINFFSTRYLLGALPLLMLGCGLLIGGLEKTLFAKILLPLVLFYGCFNIYTSMELKEFSDTELSYTKLLKAQVNMVDYLKANAPQEQIYAPFLMLVNLSNSKSGFVEEGFHFLSNQVLDTANVYYLSLPNEHEKEFDSI